MEGDSFSFLMIILVLVSTGLSLYSWTKRKDRRSETEEEGKEDPYEERASEIYREQRRR